MKKTYIIPATQIEVVQQQTIIAASPNVTLNRSSEAGVRPEDFEVKGDRGSRSDYNVWNEDWSK